MFDMKNCETRKTTTWNLMEDSIHRVFYKASGEGWGPGFNTYVRKISEEYTEQHDCLKFMNMS